MPKQSKVHIKECEANPKSILMLYSDATPTHLPTVAHSLKKSTFFKKNERKHPSDPSYIVRGIKRKGEVVKGKNMYEQFEAINHNNALLYILEVIKPNFRITEEFILKVHSIVMYSFNDKLPGKYRTGFVNITNTEKILPSAQEVPMGIKKLIRTINIYKPDAIKRIASVRHNFEAIHPFFDGNGRVGEGMPARLRRGNPRVKIDRRRKQEVGPFLLDIVVSFYYNCCKREQR